MNSGPGVWNVMGRRFERPAHITTWAVVNLDSDRYGEEVKRFALNLYGNLTKLGKSFNFLRRKPDVDWSSAGISK